MTTPVKKPSLFWPVNASLWAVIGLMQAVRLHDNTMILIAVLAIVAFWGTWAMSDD